MYREYDDDLDRFEEDPDEEEEMDQFVCPFFRQGPLDQFLPPFGPGFQGMPSGGHNPPGPPFGVPGMQVPGIQGPAPGLPTHGAPTGMPFQGPAPGLPSHGAPGGMPFQGPASGPPSGPPPDFEPQQAGPGSIGVKAVDPGSIRRCTFRFVYIWPERRRRGFWAFLTFVGPRSVAGWRWNGRRWVYFGMDLRQIESFQCF